MKKTLVVFLTIWALRAYGANPELDRMYEDAISKVKTEKDRTHAILEFRLHEYTKKQVKIEEMFQPADGIDQFEAFLLAKVYFTHRFGLCGSQGLPEKSGEEWVVPITVGRGGHPGPSIKIDVHTGKLRCEGHLGVSNAADYMRNLVSTGRAAPSVQDPREKKNEVLLATVHSMIAGDDILLWGFFFKNSSKAPLKSLATELKKRGYRIVDVSLDRKTEKWRLHVFKLEYHDADTLSQREYDLIELAQTTGLGSYDGWDVGPVGKDGQPDKTEKRFSTADIVDVTFTDEGATITTVERPAENTKAAASDSPTR